MESFMNDLLARLDAQGNLRRIPQATPCGKYIECNGRRMLNLSSNDYLGLGACTGLRSEFLQTLTPDNFLPTASSARLLTGSFPVCDELEHELARRFGTEAALTFGSGYHANAGILPAVSDSGTLILADKLVHASLIDGIRLSQARCIRFRHNDLAQAERLVRQHRAAYPRIILATESIFSMDGDRADLRTLVRIKRENPGVMLYVDEAHAFGTCGPTGLGCAEEAGCVADVDFLVGTFGKAAASVGAFVVCSRTVRDFLVNRMRTFIFTTALPPVNVAWTLFVFRRMAAMADRRERLAQAAQRLRQALAAKGYDSPSTSHILPLTLGDSHAATACAERLQEHGFYALPVRPPTVPEGTSRIRFSLTADITQEEIDHLANLIPPADREKAEKRGSFAPSSGPILFAQPLQRCLHTSSKSVYPAQNTSER